VLPSHVPLTGSLLSTFSVCHSLLSCSPWICKPCCSALSCWVAVMSRYPVYSSRVACLTDSSSPVLCNNCKIWYKVSDLDDLFIQKSWMRLSIFEGPYLGDRESCRETLKRGVSLNLTYLTRKRGPTCAVTRAWSVWRLVHGTDNKACNAVQVSKACSAVHRVGRARSAKRRGGASDVALRITRHWARVNNNFKHDKSGSNQVVMTWFVILSRVRNLL